MLDQPTYRDCPVSGASKTLLTGLLIAGTLLSGCSENTGQQSSQDNVVQRAAFAFSNTCLATLPDFESFREKARAASLRSSENIGDIRSVFLVPDSSAFVGLMDLPGAKDVEVCGLKIESSEPPSVIGTEILNASLAATGAGSEEKFPSNRFEYAIRLPNGSLLTQDAKDLGNTTSNVFLITYPVPRERVLNLISRE